MSQDTCPKCGAEEGTDLEERGWYGCGSHYLVDGSGFYQESECKNRQIQNLQAELQGVREELAVAKSFLYQIVSKSWPQIEEMMDTIINFIETSKIPGLVVVRRGDLEGFLSWAQEQLLQDLCECESLHFCGKTERQEEYGRLKQAIVPGKKEEEGER